MKGEKIETLAELDSARMKRLSVITPNTTFKKPCPAAWVMNLQGHVLNRLFKTGMFIYEKESEEDNE